MRFATKSLLALLALLLVGSAPVWAQTEREVTFQVDMSAVMDACQLDPTDPNEIVSINGGFNDWTPEVDTLEHQGDGLYATTLTLTEDETYEYKYWTTNTEWEDATGNRSYTVTSEEEQTVEVVEFADNFENACPDLGEGESAVTFQVDMSAVIDSCQLDPDDPNEIVSINGDFNDWTAEVDTLTHQGDGIYTTVLALPQDSTYFYKYWTTNTEWEDATNNRSYAVTTERQQTVPLVEFADNFDSACDTGEPADTASFVIQFAVNMQIAKTQGTFDPNNGDVVTVAGNFNAWNTGADTLTQSFLNPNVYTKEVAVDSIEVPYDLQYKFVINQPDDLADQWEQGIATASGNRERELTGDETDDVPETDPIDLSVSDETPYFSNLGPEDVFEEEASVTLAIDLRPAFYHLADSGNVPSTGGQEVTSIDEVFINGPLAGSSTADDLVDWVEPWDATGLGATPSRQLVDDGTNGDAVAGDSVYTIQLTYSAGSGRNLAGKFSVNGFDTEATAQVDHVLGLSPDTTINLIFGAINAADGLIVDECGPTSPTGRGNCVGGDYDPYIEVDNDAEPPTASVVRSGGEDDTGTAVEPVEGELASQITLSANYPNPFNPSTTFTYALPKAQQVSVRVFDALGRQVATLVDDEMQAANTYRVTFDARNLASGVYIYQLQTPERTLTQKMILVK